MYYFRKDLEQREAVKVNVTHTKHMMCLNESSLNPYSQIGPGWIKRLEQIPLNRYFNSVSAELEKRLADYTGLPADHLIWGNGADDMLYSVFTAVRENPDTFAVSLAPSYFDYKSYCSAVGLGIKFLSLNRDYDFDPAELIELSNAPECRLIILCNPNNPTGNLLDDDKIRTILEQSGKLVVIDETYFEFSGKTFADRISKYPNLVIIRSFSKAFSVAGLRFGYLISQPRNIHELKKVMTFFHLNLMTQGFVCEILANQEVFLAHNRRVIALRDNLKEELLKLPQVKVIDSATNFLTFTVGAKTQGLFSYLQSRDIAIRAVWTHPLLKDHVRVSIGSEEENSLFLEAVREFLQQGEQGEIE